jgi:hypothetical protein
MRFPAYALALSLGLAAVAPAFATAAPVTSEKPFQLTRMARAAKPGLHIRVIDPDGKLAYPVPVAIEYDSGAPVRAEATAEGLTVPADAGRTVKAVTVGGAAPQRFDVDGSRANFLVFSR